MEMNDEWIPIAWQRRSDLDVFNSAAVNIHQCVSRDYPGEKYAVRDGSCCLNKKAKWEREPMPSYRTVAFYRRCRFDSFEDARQALALAEKGEK